MEDLRCRRCGCKIKRRYFCEICRKFLIENGMYEDSLRKILKENSIQQLESLRRLYLEMLMAEDE